jgi:hypothetical protein
MNVKTILAAGAACAVLALAACGGKASFTVTGLLGSTDSGGRFVPGTVANPGLVLQNGGDTVTVAAGAASFTFPGSISYGTEYNIAVKTQPAHMTCNPYGGTGIGSAGHTTSINVLISCYQNFYSLSGTVSGLTADGLTIINGSNGTGLLIAKGATTFSYLEAVPVGVAYGLSVLTQPTGLRCTIANGTDVMGDADRANIAISCVPA